MAKPERLVIVSNRVAVTTDAARAGGLAVALSELLKKTGGVWFGWSGKVSARPNSHPDTVGRGGVTVATVDLSADDYDEYYSGFANSALWPLFHYRLDLANFNRDFYEGYLRVNRRFAHALEPMLEDDDIVWVHDYHLLAFGEELRRMGCEQPMGFFLHIPFPAPEVLTTLPVHDVIVRAMFAYDLVGFQTEGDRTCFLNYVVNEAGGTVYEDGRVSAFGRTIVAGVFPIGIDADNFAELATSKNAMEHRRRLERVLRRRHAIVGVDRLDYTKGLPERFHAFERLLKHYPENHGRVTYVQIAPTTRADVPDYVHIREELEGIAGKINGEYSELDWTPLRYINRSFSRPALAGIFRLSRVGLVTPLRDGMNLVAKEYVAAQSPRNPGVLVLSRFAGAAHQLTGALVVNPYDEQGVADALQTALNMSLQERKKRWATLVESVRRDDVVGWRESFLEKLKSVVDPKRGRAREKRRVGATR
ncbi:MAG: alpha,alpha-trehalose-phosphate synthase (UDP-forming) [Gammaproteobacteria bacterium]|nr:alpha,alpha-trehalose-phosphate synthase (UDP-forming) [Gammaproteobacteria bacterium]NIM74013.1 alpha,alpha-trehalose-phosphate synthase (UDP-forming) [Gammaproteobacteria bacterium]NIN38894.1 alpha,alpha-trehalose-phosphate synthase (UDP-forming) [Gammaproteobacteria bacterium]NIO25789.1 alpha,alpha-trehalose-phosphate synthase (UDP-forming) [Gammaproteobacteria bacterium]NIO66419.1 alpha,alpha-trehalose-phosphate synthase (UDP-forming) [Gammaproteobacteria bacterium]